MSKRISIKHLDLPDHTKNLQEVDEYILKIKERLTNIKKQQEFTLSDYDEIHEKISVILFYVGDLSKPAFGIARELEDQYTLTYKNAPELAKTLWSKHYHDIHRPYNMIKNRIFSIYEDMEKLYKEFNGTSPPDY